MNRNELLDAFRRLTSEEQDLFRVELGKITTKSEECCCSPSLKKELEGMMEQIMASETPMAMCHEMKKMCCEALVEHESCR